MKSILIVIILLISTSLLAQDKLTKSEKEYVEWTYTKFNLIEAINDLEDYIEWTQQDIENGSIDEKIGLLYIENYRQTIDRLLSVYTYLDMLEK